MPNFPVDAPEDEIQVSPAMAEVGADVMSRYFCFEIESAEEIVSSVFLAMMREAKAKPDLGE